MIGIGALAPAGLLAAGAVVAWLWLGAGCAGRFRRLLWALALAPALGYGIPALVVSACALLSRRVPGPLAFGALLALLFAMASWLAIRCATREPAPERSAGRPEPRWLLAAAVGTLLLVAASALPVVARGIRSHPSGSWDAVAIWNARASLLYRDAASARAALRDADPDSQPHYPLVLPGAVGATWTLLGYESDAAAAAVSGSWFAATLLLAGLALSAPGRRSAGLATAALLLAMPALLKWVPSQCADLAVGYGLLLAGLAGATGGSRRGWPGDRLPAGLLGLAVGLLANTKNEGTVAAAALLLGWWIVARLRGKERDPVPWRADLATALPFVALGLGQRLLLSQEVEKLRFVSDAWLLRLTDAERWSVLGGELLARFSPLRPELGWSLFWPLVLLAALGTVAVPRDRNARFPAALALAVLGSAGVLALVLSSYEIGYVVDTALDRLLAQLAPLGLVLALAPWSGIDLAATRGVAVLARAYRSFRGFLRARPARGLATVLLVVLLGKLALLRPSVGAMWRWPEELVVATSAFDVFHPVAVRALTGISAPNLVSTLLAPVDLAGLEGSARYLAMLVALHVALALLLALSVAVCHRGLRPALGWALLGSVALAGSMLLGDALAGPAFLLLLVALERVLGQPESIRAWTAVAAGSALAVAAEPSLAAPIVAALAVGLTLVPPPRSATARAGALGALAMPLLVAWITIVPDSFAEGTGAYLERGFAAPFLLLDAEGWRILPTWGVAFLRELGYLHVGTLGWLAVALPTLVGWTGRSRGLERTWRALVGAMTAALLTRAALASAGMCLAREAAGDPRSFVYGRALDFAVPAGLWIGARALRRVALRRSGRATLAAAGVAGGLAALFLTTLPVEYAVRSLQHQVVPFQTALAGVVRWAALDPRAPWWVAAALALATGLATAPLSAHRRLSARAGAAVLAATLLAGNGLVALGEVGFESSGSLRFHSSVSRVVRDAHDQGRLGALAVDAPILRLASRPESDVLRWKDSLRVLADHPVLTLAATPPPGTCPAVLTPSRLPDRDLIATFYEETLFLWAPRRGTECEPRPGGPPR